MLKDVWLQNKGSISSSKTSHWHMLGVVADSWGQQVVVQLSSLHWILFWRVQYQYTVFDYYQNSSGDFKKSPSSSIWTYFDDCFYSRMCSLSPQKPQEARQSLFFRRAEICNWATAVPYGIPCPHLFLGLPAAEVAGCHHCGLAVLGSQCWSLGSAWQTWALPNAWRGFPELSWAELGLSWSRIAWPGALSVWEPTVDKVCSPDGGWADFVLGVCKNKFDISLLTALEVMWLHLVTEIDISILSCV